MTNYEVQKVFRKAIKMCDDAGFHSDSLYQYVEFNRRKTAYGLCYTRREVTGEINSTISVSKYFVANCNEQQLLEVLCHECLHAYTPYSGHKGEWLRAAHVMNKMYGLDIERCGDYRDENNEKILLKEKIATAKYILKCPKCGQTIYRNRASNLTKYPELYLCGICNTHLERIK